MAVLEFTRGSANRDGSARAATLWRSPPRTVTLQRGGKAKVVDVKHGLGLSQNTSDGRVRLHERV